MLCIGLIREGAATLALKRRRPGLLTRATVPAGELAEELALLENLHMTLAACRVQGSWAHLGAHGLFGVAGGGGAGVGADERGRVLLLQLLPLRLPLLHATALHGFKLRSQTVDAHGVVPPRAEFVTTPASKAGPACVARTRHRRHDHTGARLNSFLVTYPVS